LARRPWAEAAAKKLGRDHTGHKGKIKPVFAAKGTRAPAEKPAGARIIAY